MGKYAYIKKNIFVEKILAQYPSAGPNPNIKGMRKLYWGDDACIIKCGSYAYKVPPNIFNWLVCNNS